VTSLLPAPIAPQPGAAAGYKSDRARQVIAALAARGVAARPLGDVVYLLASPTAAPETCAAAARLLHEALEHGPDSELPASAAASTV
jgi:adenosylmethionine-8-amino-7-oxononanoate aminotransferase